MGIEIKKGRKKGSYSKASTQARKNRQPQRHDTTRHDTTRHDTIRSKFHKNKKQYE